MMKKYIVCSLVLACSIAAPVSFAGGSSPELQAVQNQLFQLQSSQENNKKQFDNISAQIKKVQGQVGQLQTNLKQQLKQLQDNNDKTMQQLQSSYDTQLKKLTSTLNDLKARLAKKPAAKA